MAAAKLHVVKSWKNASTATHSPQKLNQHQNCKFLKVYISTSHLLNFLLSYLSFRNEWSWPQQDSPHLDDPLGRKHPCPMWMWFHSPAIYINSIHVYIYFRMKTNPIWYSSRCRTIWNATSGAWKNQEFWFRDLRMNLRRNSESTGFLSKTIQNPPAKKSRRQGQRPSVNLSLAAHISSYFIVTKQWT